MIPPPSFREESTERERERQREGKTAKIQALKTLVGAHWEPPHKIIQSYDLTLSHKFFAPGPYRNQNQNQKIAFYSIDSRLTRTKLEAAEDQA